MSEKIAQLLSSYSRLELYRDNGFRRLGLDAPTDSRALVRRFERLRVSLELGQRVGGWAFALEPAPTLEELRSSTRWLQEPVQRLVEEFFWFWPVAYPENEQDEALTAFMAGDTATATTAWSAAASRGEPAGWHNLAVYQHLLALEWLDSAEVAPEVLRGVWSDALKYWQQVLADDEVWRRVTARVAAINDPQLPVAAAGQLRDYLPTLLAEIHAKVAVRLAGRGDTESAGFQLKAITTLLPDEASAGLLEAVTQPFARRITTQLVATRRTASAIGTLWDAVAADLAVLQGLGEAAAVTCAKQMHEIAVWLLEAIREGEGDSSSATDALAHVLVVLDLVSEGAATELAEQRFAHVLALALAAMPENRVEPEQTRLLLCGSVIPALARLTLPPLVRLAVHGRVAGWLKMLAENAIKSSPALLPWAFQAMDTACGLPLGPDNQAALETTLAGWSAEPVPGKRPALVLAASGHSLRINTSGVQLDGVMVASAQLTGVCHRLPGFEAEGSGLLRWSDADRVYALPEVFAANVATFNSVLTTVHQLVLPHLINRILQAVRAGEKVPLGPLQLHLDGIFTSDSSNPRPYPSLRLATDSSVVSLGDKSDPRFVVKLDPSADWNVPLLPLLLLILTPR